MGHAEMSGFTILETMVAMVVAAVMLAGLYSLFGKNLTAVDGAEADARAVLLAQSRLEGMGVTRALHTGTTSGQTDDGYRWVEEVHPEESEPRDVRAALVPYAVRVTVSWQSERGPHSLSLDTVRLAAP